MNALTAAIETVKAIAIANAKAQEVAGWEKEFGGLGKGWTAHKNAQQMDVTATNGDVVTVIAAFAADAGTAGRGDGVMRITYKLNGKRAKGADVHALEFAEPAAAESCADLSVKNEIVSTDVRGSVKFVTCKVYADTSAAFFASVVYIDGRYTGFMTWHTQEQAKTYIETYQ